MQRLLNAAAWGTGGVRDDVRAYVTGHLGAADGVLAGDETGFLKRAPVGRGAADENQYLWRRSMITADAQSEFRGDDPACR
jgi:hypothetical protein